MNWLEVSLTLDGELAEAVADVLAPYARQGVSIESTAIASDPNDEGRAVGPLRVRAYLDATDAAALEAARQDLERDLFYLNMIQPLPAPQYTMVADADWAELWKAHYQPIRAGKRLVIVPAWLQPPLEPNDVAVLIDPGMAFGTGTHPTTQLCLALIEDHLQPGAAALDLGCGSGILAIACAKLGARSVLAVDVDEESIRAARANAAANGVSEKIETRLGSLAAALAQPVANGPALDAPAQFQLAAANILAVVIAKLLAGTPSLGDSLIPGGTLIVSGILAEQTGKVVAALNRARLDVIEKRQRGDWIALAARRGDG